MGAMPDIPALLPARSGAARLAACWLAALGGLLTSGANAAADDLRRSTAIDARFKEALPLHSVAGEGVSFLQKSAAKSEKAPAQRGDAPHVIRLRRESVPIYRRGKVASFKTCYSGILNVGSPPQEFRMVFDTGSAHLVLPSRECNSESCLVHQRFSTTSSSTALPINTDGSAVLARRHRDRVKIGFGTGEISGEFVKDIVCFSMPRLKPTDSAENAASVESDAELAAKGGAPLCVDMHVVLAVEMSTQPFKAFSFDGILGLSLEGLALTRNFSAFGMLLGTGRLHYPRFGFFLTEGENGEESEIAIGGYNPNRVLEPLTWAPVAMSEMGFWQVSIVAVRINGKVLDVCRDGTCRGIVDTGTSHLGIPAPYDAEVASLLTVPAGDMLDCRFAVAPNIEIEISNGYNISLQPFNYMRLLPVEQGVSLGSDITTSAGTAGERGRESGGARPSCGPRLMAVKQPAPLGPKIFILGEPVLHRYYTVFDWAAKSVGFGLASNRWNTMGAAEIARRRGDLLDQADVWL